MLQKGGLCSVRAYGKTLSLVGYNCNFSLARSMIPEEVFYLFIFPWIGVIAAVPGIPITFVALGWAAQALGLLSDKSSDAAEVS